MGVLFFFIVCLGVLLFLGCPTFCFLFLLRYLWASYFSSFCFLLRYLWVSYFFSSYFFSYFFFGTNYFHKHTDPGHLRQRLRLRPEQTEPKAAIKNHQAPSKESPPQPLRFVCSNNGRGQNRPHRPDSGQQLPPRYPRPTAPYSWLLPEPSVPLVLA